MKTLTIYKDGAGWYICNDFFGASYTESDLIKRYIKNCVNKSNEFNTVRKNALANPNLYCGRYTQKNRITACTEYFNTSILIKRI